MSDFKDKLKEAFTEEVAKYLGVGAVVAGFAYMGLNLIDPQGKIEAVRKQKLQEQQKIAREADLDNQNQDIVIEDQIYGDELGLELGKSQSQQDLEDIENRNDNFGNSDENQNGPRVVPIIAKAPTKAKSTIDVSDGSDSNNNSNDYDFSDEDLEEASEEEIAEAEEDFEEDIEDEGLDDVVAVAAAEEQEAFDDLQDEIIESTPDPGAPIDAPRIQVSLISNNTDETGTIATFALQITGRAPGDPVDITFTINDPDEVVITDEAGDGSADGILTLTSNDMATDFYITVAGVDDSIIDGTQPWSITVEAVHSSDAGWDYISSGNPELQKTINGLNEDDDFRGLLIGANAGGDTTNALNITPTYSFNVDADNSYIDVQFDYDVDCATPNSDNFKVLVEGTELTGSFTCPSPAGSDYLRWTIGGAYTDFTAFYAEDLEVRINQYAGFQTDYPNTSVPQPLADIRDAGGVPNHNNNFYTPANFEFKIQPQVNSLALGFGHTCAETVDNGGSIVCWGKNDYGQVGLGNTNQHGDNVNEMGSALHAAGAFHNSTTFGGHTVSKVAAGGDSTCIIDSNADLHCWGRNNKGQLGLGSTTNIGDDELLTSANTLVLDGSVSAVSEVAIGALHTCAIVGGGVRCWGDNNHGQLGQGNRTNLSSPPGAAIDLNGLNALKLAAGKDHTCVIRDNTPTDDVVCFGGNAYGQLGVDHALRMGDQPGEMGASLVAVNLGGLVPVDIKAGDNHTCVLSNDDKLFCWGSNVYGQLGQENATTMFGASPGSMATVNAISLPSTPLAFDAGVGHTCLTYANNESYCFGLNNYGQLGRGNSTNIGSNAGDIAGLSAINTGSDVSANSLYVAAGGGHTCFILASGEIRCVGSNGFGQLGNQYENWNVGDDSHEVGDFIKDAYIKNKVALDYGYNMTPLFGNGSSDRFLDLYFAYDSSVSYDQVKFGETRSCTVSGFTNEVWNNLNGSGTGFTETDIFRTTPSAGKKYISYQFRNSADPSIQSKCYIREYVLTGGTPSCNIAGDPFTKEITNYFLISDTNPPQGLEYKVSADNDCTTDAGATWENYSPVYAETITAGDGVKSVSVQCRNGSLSACSTFNFQLDTTGPDIDTPVILEPVANSPLAIETIRWNTTEPGTGVNSATDVGIRHECSLVTPAAHSKFADTGFRACADICTTYSGDDDTTNVECTIDHENVDGTYTMDIRAIDALGNVGSTESFSWLSDQTGPTCTITAIDGALPGLFPSKSRLNPVPFEFDCTDAGSGVDIAEVECSLIQTIPPAVPTYTGADELHTKPCPETPAQWNALVDSDIENEYTVFIRAKDLATNQGDPVTHTWDVDTLEPEISRVYATDGTYTLDGNNGYLQTVSIKVEFSEVVNVTGTPQIQLETGSSDAIVDYTSGDGTNTLTFDYTVALDEWSDDLDVLSANVIMNGGTIRDPSGNHCDANDDEINTDCTIPRGVNPNSLASQSDVVIDGTRLRIVDVTSPTSDTSANFNGQYKIGDVITIHVEFADPEDAATAAKNNATVAGGTPTLELETGAIDQKVNQTGGSGTNTLVFTYTVIEGDVSNDLNYELTTSLALAGSTIRDRHGNNAVVTLPATAAANSLAGNKALVIDGVRPVLDAVNSTTLDGIANRKIENDIIPIDVTFDDAVRVITTGGTPYLTVDTNPDNNVAYTSGGAGAGSTSLRFDYTVLDGENSLDLDYPSTAALVLNGGLIQDGSGNDAIIVLDPPGTGNSLGNLKDIIVDTTEPTILGVSAINANTSGNTDGDYKIGDLITVEVTYSEPVVVDTVGGTPSILLELGATDRPATYNGTGSGTNKLQFDYTVIDGDASADLEYVDATTSFQLNGGTIKDLATNDLDTDLPAIGGGASLSDNKDIVIDGIRPRVTHIDAPEADGTYILGQGINIEIHFDEAVTVVAPNPQITLETTVGAFPAQATGNDAVVTYSSGSGTNTLRFTYSIAADQQTPDLDLLSASIVTTGTLRDSSDNDIVLTLPIAASGNQLDERKDLVIDSVVPRIDNVTASNADNSTNPSTQWRIGEVITVQVEFDQAVNVLGGTPTLQLETGADDVIVNMSGGDGTSTLEFAYTIRDGDSSADLEYLNTAALALNGATIKDANGNDANLTLPTIGGGNSLSDNKQIVVDGIRPRITVVNSSTVDGTYKAGDLLNVFATFDDDVYPSTGAGATTNIFLELETGPTDRNATYNGTGNGTPTINFDYTVISGDTTNDLTVNSTAIELTGGATLVDHSGNPVVLTLPTSGGSDELHENRALDIDGVIPEIVRIYSSTADNSANPDQEYKIGDVINVTVEFTENVDLGGNNILNVPVGVGATNTSQNASYAGGTGTNTYTFNYTVQQDDVSPDLATFGAAIVLDGGATLQDGAGNNVILTIPTAGATDELAEVKAMKVDGIPPRITNVASKTVDGTYIIGQEITIEVTFDQPVFVVGTPGTSPSFLVNVGPTNTTQSATWNGNGSTTNTLEFTYTIQQDDVIADLSMNSPSLVLGASTVRDDSDNNALLTFPTAGPSDELDENSNIVVDGVPPRITNVTSSNADATYDIGDVITIQVTFDQAIYVSTLGTATGDISFAVETGTNDPSATYNGTGHTTNTLEFNYTVINGDQTNDLALKDAAITLANAKTLKDINGNNAVLAFPTAGPSDQLIENKDIVIDGIVPQITTISAITGNGLYKAGDTIQLQVDFSEDVSVVSGLPQLLIEAGAVDATAVYSGAVDSDTLQFDFVVSSTMDSLGSDISITASDLDLNGGVITDTPGNPVLTAIPTVGVSDELAENASIQIDGIAPSIASVNSTSADGTYNQYSPDLDVRILFSEAVVVTGGVAAFDLETGASDATATYVSGDGSDTFVFTYDILAGHETSDLELSSSALSGVTLTDVAGNPITTYNFPTGGSNDQLAENKAIVIDGTSPTITNVTATNTDGVYIEGQTITLEVTFSENVNLGGAGSVNFQVETGASDGTATYTGGDGTNKFTFDYTVAQDHVSADLATLSPGIILGGTRTLQDSAGNAVVLTFPTAGPADELDENKAIEIDGIPPRITSVTATNSDTSSNASGAYAIGEVINIRVIFDQAVVVAGGTPTLELETGTSDQIVNMSGGSTTTTLEFDYTILDGHQSADLAYKTAQLLLGGATIKDINGNDALLSTLPASGGANSLSNNKDIVIDGIRPIITNVTSADADGLKMEGDLITIQFVFNDNVYSSTAGTATGDIFVQLETGSTDRNASYNGTGNGTNTLEMEYTVILDDNTTDLSINSAAIQLANGKTIQDDSGNDAVLTLPTTGGSDELDENKNIIIDGVKPYVLFVSSSSPDVHPTNGNGKYRSGDTIDITVRFSEIVNLGGAGVPTVAIATGPVTTSQDAIYAGGDGTNELTFTYTVQDDDVSTDLAQFGTALVLNGRTLQDDAGNDALLVFPTAGGTDELIELKDIVVDGRVPRIVRVTSPDTSQVYIEGDTITLYVEFDEAVTVAGGTPSFELNTNEVSTPTTEVYPQVVNATQTATYNGTGSGTTRLEFTYTVQQDDVNDDLDLNSTALALNGATLVDASGNSATGGYLTFPTAGASDELHELKDIEIDGEPPRIINVSSTTGDGFYKVGDTILIQVQFNDNVYVTGAAGALPNTLELTFAQELTTDQTPDDSEAFYTSVSGDTITFTYVVEEGESTSDLEVIGTKPWIETQGTARVRDVNGNLAYDNPNSSMQYPLPIGANGGALSNNHTIQTDGLFPYIVNIAAVNADGLYKGGDVIQFDVDFNENVQVDSGVPRILIEAGSRDVYANYVSQTDTDTLRFQFTVSLDTLANFVADPGVISATGGHDSAGAELIITASDMELNGSVITDDRDNVLKTASTPISGTEIPDNAGNDTLAENSDIVIDGIKPRIDTTTTTTADALYNEDTDATTVEVLVNFSEPTYRVGTPTFQIDTDFTPTYDLEVASSNINMVYASGDTTVQHQFYFTMPQWHISNDMSLQSTQFTGAVTDLTDEAGNPIETLTFPTAGASDEVDETAAVQIDTVKPVAWRIRGDDGTYDANIDEALTLTDDNSNRVYIYVDFSDTVYVSGGGSSRLALQLDQTANAHGGQAYANYLDGSGTSTLRYVYYVQTSTLNDTADYGDEAADLDIAGATIDITAGTIKDINGNDIIVTVPTANGSDQLAELNDIVIDGHRPKVINETTTLADGHYGVELAVFPIQLVFDDNVYVSGTPRITLNTGDVLNYSRGSGTNTLEFDYQIGEGDSVAELSITSTALDLNGALVRDVNGNDVHLTLADATTFEANHDIQVDGLHPYITNVYGNTVNGLYKGGDLIEIDVDFNEEVTVTSGTPRLLIEAGSRDVYATYASKVDADTLRFQFTVSLDTLANFVADPGAISATGGHDSAGAIIRIDATDLDLNGALVEDNRSNNLMSSSTPSGTLLPTAGGTDQLQENSSIVIDGVKPRIDRTYSNTPDTNASHASGVYNEDTPSSDLEVLVEFSEPTYRVGTPTFQMDTDFTATYDLEVSASNISMTFIGGDTTNTHEFNFPMLSQWHGTSDFSLQSASFTGAVTDLTDEAGNPIETLAFPTAGASDEVDETSDIIIDTVKPVAFRIRGDDGTYDSNIDEALTLTDDNSNRVYIYVDFSDTVYVSGGGASRLALALDQTANAHGGQAYANYLDGSGTSTLRYVYYVQTSTLNDTADYGDEAADLDIAGATIDITAGTIKDINGNDIIVTVPTANGSDQLAELNDIVIDGHRPKVITETSSTADGHYGVEAALIPVQLIFDDNVYVSGTPRITLNTGDVLTYSRGSGSTTLEFDYDIGEGDSVADLAITSTAIDLNGGLIRDVNGNDVHLTLADATTLEANKDLQIDGLHPYITNVYGNTADGLYKGGDLIEIDVDFNEEVTVTSGTPRLLIEAGSRDVYATYASKVDADTLRFQFTVSLDTLANFVADPGAISATGGHDSAGAIIRIDATDLDLNGALVEDNRSNNLMSSSTPSGTLLPTTGASNQLAENSAIVIDGIKPRIDTTTSTTTDALYNEDTNATTVEVRVNFSEPTYRVGSPTFQLDTDFTATYDLEVSSSNVNVNYSSGDTTTTHVFYYPIPQWHITSDLAMQSTAFSGAVTDLTDEAGNPIETLSFPTSGGSDEFDETSAIQIDTVKPVAYRIRGVDGTYDSNIDEALTLTNDNSNRVYIYVDFSDTVYVSGGGASRIALALTTVADSHGGTAYANYLDGSGTSTLRYVYYVQSAALNTNITTDIGDTASDLNVGGASIDITAGTIRDVNGNDIVTTVPTANGSDELDELNNIVIDGRRPYAVTETSSTANGHYGTDSPIIPIQLVFNDTVYVSTAGGTPSITLNTGDTISYSGGSGTNTIYFNYDIGEGDTVADLDISSAAIALNGGLIRDVNGNDIHTSLAAATTLAANKNIQVDGLHPYITNVGGGATNASGLYKGGDVINIDVDFNEAVSVTSGTPRLLIEAGARDVYANYSGAVDADTLRFTFTVDLASLAQFTGNTAGHDSAGAAISTKSATLDLNGALVEDARDNDLIFGSTPSGTTLPTTGANNELDENRNIRVDGVRPQITGTTSSTANGMYNQDTASVNVQVLYSEPVNRTGSNTFQLNTDFTASHSLESSSSNINLTYSSGSGTATHNYTFPMPDWHQSSDLSLQSSAMSGTTAQLRDLAGNDLLSLTFPTGGGSDELDEAKNIQIDTVPPVITGISASNGTYIEGESVDIYVSFSDNVYVSGGVGSSYFTLSDSVGSATYQSGSGSSTLRYRYTVSNNDESADLDTVSALTISAGTITDVNGNDLITTIPAGESLADTNAVVIDGRPPRITNVTSSNANGSYGIGATIAIQVTFDEAVFVSGGTPTFSVNTGGTASFSSGSGSSTLTFNYTVAEAHGDTSDLNYSGTISGATILDSDGNAVIRSWAGPSLAANKNISIDSLRPTITGISYTSNSGCNSNVYCNAGDSVTITVSFSEAVDRVSGGSFSLDSGGTASWSGGDGTANHTFVYTVAGGHNTGNLNATGSLSGTFRDMVTNSANALTSTGMPGTALGRVIDTVNPSVSGVSWGGRVNASARAATWSRSDATSGISYCQARSENGSYSGSQSSGVSLGISSLPDSSKGLYVRCYDNAGNVTQSSSATGLMIGNRTSAECSSIGGSTNWSPGYCIATSTSSSSASCPGGWSASSYYSFSSVTCTDSGACGGGSRGSGSASYSNSPARPSCTYTTSSVAYGWRSYGHGGSGCAIGSPVLGGWVYGSSCPSNSCPGTWNLCSSAGNACTITSCTSQCGHNATSYANYNQVGCY